MSYLDDEQELLARYASFASEQALLLAGQLADNNPGVLISNQLSGFKTYREAVVDTTNSTSNQLGALSMMVTYGQLDQIPIPPTFNAFNPAFIPTPSYTGVHNDLLGLNVGDYQHLTQSQLTKLNNLPTSFGFSVITGSPSDNAALASALNGKQPLISAGTTNQFYAWDKTFKSVSFAGLSGRPSTLAGYGISSSDTLFDSRYLRLISPLTGLGAGSNTPITSASTVLGAFANLQAQITAGTGITALTGDVTATGPGSSVAAIGANKVTNGMLAQVGTATFKGRITASTGNVQDLTATQATSILNTFTAALKGLVPPPVTATGKYLKDDGTWAVPTGAGTVTSVAASGPAGLLTWSAAVTTSGTLTATLATQAANTVFAGPTTGVNAVPTFRSLVASDIPTISQGQVSGLSASLSGKLGTNITQGKFYVGNVSDIAAPVTPSGDWTMTYAGVSTISNNVVTFAKLQQATDPSVLIGTPSGTAGAQNFTQITIGSGLTMSALGVLTSGGLVNPMTAVGDLIVGGTGGDPTALAIGANTYVLTSNGTTAVWSPASGGGSGDVSWIGSGSAVVTGIATYSNVNGQIIQSPSNATVTSTGDGSFRSLLVTGTAGNGHLHMRHQGSAVSGIANSNTIYALSSASSGFGVIINNTAYVSSLIFGATTAQSYTFPDLTGTVALLANAASFSSLISTTSITSGTASATAGTLVLQNATNAFTQTIRGTNPSASIIYDLPTTAPTIGQLLTASAPSAGVVTLSWSTVSGSGVTTVGTFSGSAQTNGANITGTTITFGPASATVPGMVSTGTQTFAGAKTFSSTIAYSPTSGTALSIAASSSGAAPNINWSSGAAIGMTGIGSGTYALTFSFNSGSLTERFRMYGGVNGDNYFLLGTTTLSAVVAIKDTAVASTPGIALFDGVNKTLASGVTEIINFHVNGAYTWTRNPGGAGLTQATQRHTVFAAPTYAGVTNAYTITNAATVAISGAPAAGASMTITNPLAFWVQAGKVRLDGGGAWSGLPTGNAGLVSGDLYVDTAANVLLNSDLVVARKV